MYVYLKILSGNKTAVTQIQKNNIESTTICVLVVWVYFFLNRPVSQLMWLCQARNVCDNGNECFPFYTYVHVQFMFNRAK